MQWKPFVSHAAAFAVGCALFAGGGGLSDKENGRTAGEGEKPRFRRERPASGADPAGEALLAEMTGHLPRRDAPVRGRGPGDGGRIAREINLMADSFPRAADVRAAAIALLEEAQSKEEYTPEEWRELQCRLIHWMREDPAGAIAYIYRGGAGERDSYMFLQTALGPALERAGAGAAVTWLEAVAREPGADIGKFYKDMLPGLSQAVGEQADTSMAQWVLGNDPPDRQDLLSRMLASWPVEKADKLLEMTIGRDDLSFLAQYGTGSPEAARWLMGLLGSGKLDEKARDQIMGDANYQLMLLQDSTLPLEARISGMADAGGTPPQEATRMFAERDVQEALDSGRDWRHAFRGGAAGAEEIYQDLAARLPELAAKAPDELRNQIFRELAEENPQAAIQWLGGGTSAENWETMASASLHMFTDTDPQRFYDYLQNIPLDATENTFRMRRDAWQKQVSNLERLGGGYILWVYDLPQGIDREMALISLSRTGVLLPFSKDIKDPRLLELSEPQ